MSSLPGKPASSQMDGPRASEELGRSRRAARIFPTRLVIPDAESQPQPKPSQGDISPFIPKTPTCLLLSPLRILSQRLPSSAKSAATDHPTTTGPGRRSWERRARPRSSTIDCPSPLPQDSLDDLYASLSGYENPDITNTDSSRVGTTRGRNAIRRQFSLKLGRLRGGHSIKPGADAASRCRDRPVLDSSSSPAGHATNCPSLNTPLETPRTSLSLHLSISAPLPRSALPSQEVPFIWPSKAMTCVDPASPLMHTRLQPVTASTSHVGSDAESEDQQMARDSDHLHLNAMQAKAFAKLHGTSLNDSHLPSNLPSAVDASPILSEPSPLSVAPSSPPHTPARDSDISLGSTGRLLLHECLEPLTWWPASLSSLEDLASSLTSFLRATDLPCPPEIYHDLNKSPDDSSSYDSLVDTATCDACRSTDAASSFYAPEDEESDTVWEISPQPDYAPRLGSRWSAASEDEECDDEASVNAGNQSASKEKWWSIYDGETYDTPFGPLPSDDEESIENGHAFRGSHAGSAVGQSRNMEVKPLFKPLEPATRPLQLRKSQAQGRITQKDANSIVSVHALYVMLEIVSTERAYLAALRVLLAQDASAIPNPLPPALMFESIQKLVDAGEHFLREIEGLFREAESSNGTQWDVGGDAVIGMVAKAFLVVEQELGNAMVSWSSVVGAFFSIGPSVGAPGALECPAGMSKWKNRWNSPGHMRPSSPSTKSTKAQGQGSSWIELSTKVEQLSVDTPSTSRRSASASSSTRSNLHSPSNSHLGEVIWRHFRSRSHPVERDRDKAVFEARGEVRINAMTQRVREVAILPIQRVTRYVLLFKDLLGHISQCSSAHAVAAEAVEAAEAMALACNEAQQNDASLRLR